MKPPTTILNCKCFLGIFLIMSTFCVIIQSVTAQNIPDANFAQAIRNVCPTCIDASNNLLPPATTLINLNVENKNIVSLAGLQGFTSLQTFWAVDNQIPVLPTLPTNLISLGMRGNLLTTVSSLPNGLTLLDLDRNPVTSLPTLPSSLTQLWVQGCQLSSLPALPSGLTLLYCTNNQLTALPTLPNSLTKIECRGNQLTSLPALPNSLTELICYANLITSLPTLPGTLTKLRIDADKITCLPNPVVALQVYNANNILITTPLLCTLTAPGGTVLLTPSSIQNSTGMLSSGSNLKLSNAIQIGNSTETVAGTIRWTGADFEGYTGSAWKSLTAGTTSPTGYWQALTAGFAPVCPAGYTQALDINGKACNNGAGTTVTLVSPSPGNTGSYFTCSNGGASFATLLTSIWCLKTN